MYELELLARLVDTGTLAKHRYLLHAEYFVAYPEVFQFLSDYDLQFNVLPNRDTVHKQFPEIKLPESKVDVEWLIDEVAQDFIAGQLRESALIMTTALASEEADPRAIAKEYISKTSEMQGYFAEVVSTCTDALTDTNMTLAEFRRKMEHGEAGITFGLPLLDKITNGGTKRAEIEIFMGRPGDGKTTMLLYTLFRANRAGHRVAFLSPEMERFEISTKIDTLRFHLSNEALIGMPTAEIIELYEEMIAAAQPMPPFSIHVPNQRRFTTADVMAIADRERPAIIGIDGLLFLEPIKKYNGPRERITNVMEELKSVVRVTGIPLRIAHQVNRESEKLTSARRRRDSSKFDAMPQMHQLAESGSVEQFANRIFSIKHFAAEQRTYMVVCKNRNGKPGQFISCSNDIDLGYINDDREESLDADSDDTQPQQQTLDQATAGF